MHVIELEHTTETGHRIPGSGPESYLHGHSYRYHVQLSAETLDPDTGFLVDFGAIKGLLDQWDHRMLLWEEDTVLSVLDLGKSGPPMPSEEIGVIRVPFIPTAENMAIHLSHRFVREFESVVFCQIEVRETVKTVARYYSSEADAQREVKSHRALRGVS